MDNKPWFKAAINAVQAENPHHTVLPWAIAAFAHDDRVKTRSYLAMIAHGKGPDKYLAPATRAIICAIVE